MLCKYEPAGDEPAADPTLNGADGRQLAEVLHDGVMQLLSTLRLKVRMLYLEADALSAEGRANLRDIDALSDRALSDLTTLVRDLAGIGEPGRPIAARERRELVVRLERIARTFQVDTDIACSTDLNAALLRFPPVLEDVICRSVGELLNNVEKHAGATRVQIRSDDAGDGFVAIGVIDNGKGSPGFTWSNLPYAASGLGLLSIQGRLADFGASVEVEGRNGFSARLLIPKGFLVRAD